jgi:hypothetical protein
MDERLINEIGNIDPVYVDGVATVLDLGPNFGTVYFRYVPVQSGGQIIYTKTPILYLVRPRASSVCRCELQPMIGTAPLRIAAGMN